MPYLMDDTSTSVVAGRMRRLSTIAGVNQMQFRMRTSRSLGMDTIVSSRGASTLPRLSRVRCSRLGVARMNSRNSVDSMPEFVPKSAWLMERWTRCGKRLFGHGTAADRMRCLRGVSIQILERYFRVVQPQSQHVSLKHPMRIFYTCISSVARSGGDRLVTTDQSRHLRKSHPYTMVQLNKSVKSAGRWVRKW